VVEHTAPRLLLVFRVFRVQRLYVSSGHLQPKPVQASSALHGHADEGGHADQRRLALLVALSQIPGVYVPSLYRVTYVAPDGEISSIRPIAR
jgi:hypothetical protein